MAINVGVDLKSSLKESCTSWLTGAAAVVETLYTGELLKLITSSVTVGGVVAIDAPLVHWTSINAEQDHIALAEACWRNPRKKSKVSCWAFRPWEYFVCYASGLPGGCSTVPFSRLPLTPRGLALRKLLGQAGFALSTVLVPNGKSLIEVHPGLVLLLLWIDTTPNAPFPVYKSRDAELRTDLGAFHNVLTNLGVAVPAAFANDDELDALVACYMADLFSQNKTVTIGDRRSGFVVLPDTMRVQQMKKDYSQLTAEWHLGD